MKALQYIIFAILVIAGIALWRFPDAPLSKALSAQIIRVGTNAEYPPFSFRQDGKIVGFDIDIAEEIAHRIDKEVKLEDMAFDMLMAQLQSGALDMVAAGLSITPERQQQALFTSPHLAGDPLLIITRTDQPPLKSLKDLREKIVIVNQGFTAELYMQQVRGLNLRPLPTVAEAFIALEQSRGDAFVTAASAVAPFFKKYGKEKFNVLPLPGYAENYSLAVSKKNPVLFKEVQEALVAMGKDGTLTAIRKKWGLL